MSILEMNLPEKLSLTAAIDFCNRLQVLPETESLVLDFRRLEYVEPFTMAIVSTEFQRYRDGHPNTRVLAGNYAHLTYAAHMGFFKSFGLNAGNQPGQAKGGPT
jgi:hypothetical protein